MTCLKHNFLFLTKHGLHLPCVLFADFLLTLSFSVNLVPIMSLRFLFWRKTKLGEFQKFILDLELYEKDANTSLQFHLFYGVFFYI